MVRTKRQIGSASLGCLPDLPCVSSWQPMQKILPLLLLIPLFGCDCEGGGGLHQKKADISVSPDPLVFDTIPRGTTASAYLHVENPGDFRLEVTGVTIE